MLGIIIALPTECETLLKVQFKDVFIHTIQHQKYYVIKTLSGSLAVLAFCGVGRANAASITTLMISSFNIKACFNIGSVGVIDGFEVQQLLLIDKTLYCDVDATAFGYAQNQIPKMPTLYETDNQLNEILTQILTATGLVFKLGTCHTADSFLNSNNFSRYFIEKTITPSCVDMECAAIAQTCYLLKVPFCAVKIGVDKL